MSGFKARPGLKPGRGDRAVGESSGDGGRTGVYVRPLPLGGRPDADSGTFCEPLGSATRILLEGTVGRGGMALLLGTL